MQRYGLKSSTKLISSPAFSVYSPVQEKKFLNMFPEKIPLVTQDANEITAAPAD